MVFGAKLPYESDKLPYGNNMCPYGRLTNSRVKQTPVRRLTVVMDFTITTVLVKSVYHDFGKFKIHDFVV